MTVTLVGQREARETTVARLAAGTDGTAAETGGD